MSRVLVTGGAGTIGAAVVRRLLRDADWEVRVADQREAPHHRGADRPDAARDEDAAHAVSAASSLA